MISQNLILPTRGQAEIDELAVWRGILDKNFIRSYHKVYYIEFACILSYGNRYVVMSYSVMLYCNRNTVISSLVAGRKQNSIVSYSTADVSYPVAIDRNLCAVVSYSVTRYGNLNDIVSYPVNVFIIYILRNTHQKAVVNFRTQISSSQS